MPPTKKGAAGSRDGSSVRSSSEGSSVNSDTSLGVLGRNEEGSDGLLRGSTTSKKASWDGWARGGAGPAARRGLVVGAPPGVAWCHQRLAAG